MSEPAIIAFSTCPDEAAAQRISAALVAERLAACVNRVSGVRSCYVWDGALQDEGEVLLMIKSTESQVPRLERRLKELHPYELPEFVVVRVAGGNEQYLEWIRGNVGSKGD